MSFEPGAAPAGLIPLCVPEIRGNEWRYLKECLDTGWVSSVGPFVDRFEKDLAAYLGGGHAVATVNGTAALHIALLVAGVQPGDEVLLPTLTFIAPANAVRYVGAWPVFLDVEPTTWQLDVERLRAFLERQCERVHGAWHNRRTGRCVRALLPVHVLGHPVDMDPLLDLARKFELPVIEDATESLGACYKGRKVGLLGDIACFSFNGNKIITTGGGGMIVTRHRPWAERARYLTTQAKDDPLEYIHGAVGYNYRLTNLQAAVGCAQLEQLDDYIAAKRALAARYNEALADVPGVTLPGEAPWASGIAWLYTILVDEVAYGMSSRDLLGRLGRAGVQARPLWQPLHLSPAHASSPPSDCPVADALYRTALSLPCSVGLAAADQERVVELVASPERLETRR